MTLLLVLAVLSVAISTYALAHALRHDPRRPDVTPPRSHVGELPVQPWYAATPRESAGRWAA